MAGHGTGHSCFWVRKEDYLALLFFGGGFLQSVQQGFLRWVELGTSCLKTIVAGTDLLAVEFIVAAVIGAESGAFERDAGERGRASGGVGKNFGAQGDISVFGGGCAANWAGGGAGRHPPSLTLLAEHAACGAGAS